AARRLRDVPPNRIARDPHRARALPLGPLLDENLVPDDVYLIHAQHPPAECTPSSGEPLSAPVGPRRVDQFSSGGWIRIRAARSPRRAEPARRQQPPHLTFLPLSRRTPPLRHPPSPRPREC